MDAPPSMIQLRGKSILALNDKPAKAKARDTFDVMILFDPDGVDGLPLEMARHMGNELRNAGMGAFHVDMANATNPNARHKVFLNHLGNAKAFVSCPARLGKFSSSCVKDRRHARYLPSDHSGVVFLDVVR